MFKAIKELRRTEKGRILFKFILYMIFFVFIVLLIVITNAVNPPKKHPRQSSSDGETPVVEEKKELTYFEKQEKLLTGNYDFTYQIKGDTIVEYVGEYTNGYVVGYRETEDELIKYSIEDGVVYLNEFSGKTEYNDLYLDLDENLFDLKGLFSRLNSTSAIIEKNGEEKTYKYTIENYIYLISTDDESIFSIEIYDDSIKYVFNYEY